MIMEPIVNKVAASGLITIDFEEWVNIHPYTAIDLSPVLFQGLVMREADLKEWLKNYDYLAVKGQNLIFQCPDDIILQKWVPLLVFSRFAPYAAHMTWGNTDDLFNDLLQKAILAYDISQLQGARIVLKGCSKYAVKPATYSLAVDKFQPVAQSILYGEPCSTVPIYKKK